MLREKHMLPLTRLVDQIRKECGKMDEVPYFDPLDGGIRAQCLFILEAPGPNAVKSGFISRNNPDESAKNFFEFNAEAGIPRKETIIWNIVPYYIGSGGKIRAANIHDIKTGLPYLLQLIEILPRLRVIVLTGKKAQRVKNDIRRIWQNTIIDCYHPSPVFVNRDRRGNKTLIINKLRQVAEIIGIR